ncbi:DUF7575 domain-containing protein [Companilactobacillus versmoldensis]|uniref:DUF7575 domain-containing protein n=1 Tax=Companilactobacillus versmoldensis DSM 14857 = KCTC 3814 TaxID=1423815 RepID=A0A0R1SE82_9LACO|nr:zinc ribbon domain-containing protein [Companilactobacillus versmoldensis]KRL67527.1 hypothetical protein FC27_GL001843 [Companilactobacillus versmoldensis DSM 14857 = KCTC 3814]
MRKCPNCGKEVDPGQEFCIFCGTKLSESKAQTDSSKNESVEPSEFKEGTAPKDSIPVSSVQTSAVQAVPLPKMTFEKLQADTTVESSSGVVLILVIIFSLLGFGFIPGIVGLLISMRSLTGYGNRKTYMLNQHTYYWSIFGIIYGGISLVATVVYLNSLYYFF